MEGSVRAAMEGSDGCAEARCGQAPGCSGDPGRRDRRHSENTAPGTNGNVKGSSVLTVMTSLAVSMFAGDYRNPVHGGRAVKIERME